MDDIDIYRLKRAILAASTGLATIQSLVTTHNEGAVSIGADRVTLTSEQKTDIVSRIDVVALETKARLSGLDVLTGKVGVADQETLAAGAPRLLGGLVATLATGLQRLDSSIPFDGSPIVTPDEVAQNLANLSEGVRLATDVAIQLEKAKLEL